MRVMFHLDFFYHCHQLAMLKRQKDCKIIDRMYMYKNRNVSPFKKCEYIHVIIKLTIHFFNRGFIFLSQRNDVFHKGQRQ